MKSNLFLLAIIVLVVSTAAFAANDLKWTSTIKYVGSNVAGEKYTISAEFTYNGANPVKGCVITSFATQKQCSEFVPSRTYQYINQENTIYGKNDIYFELILTDGSTDSNSSNNKITYSFNSTNPPTYDKGTVFVMSPDYQFRPIQPMPDRDVFAFLNTMNKDLSVQLGSVKKIIDGWSIEFYIISNGPECFNYPSARIKHSAIGMGTSNSVHEFGILGIAIPELCKGEKQKVTLNVPYPGISVIQVNPDYVLPESDYNNNTVSTTNK